MEKEARQETVMVRALPLFYQRRFITINGLTKNQFRELKNGEAVLIDKKHFDKDLYIKDK